MRILVSDPTRLDDLVAYLRRCGCSADPVGWKAVEASPPRANVDFCYLRMELDAYLRVWRQINPDVRVDLVDRDARSTAAVADSGR